MSASPNLIFNRIAPRVGAACAEGTRSSVLSLLAPFHKWRFDRRLRVYNSDAAAAIKSALPEGFTPRAFAARARDDYQRLFAALQTGDAQVLKRLLAGAALAGARAGLEAAPPPRARIVAWDEAASGVASCGTHALSKATGFAAKPDFVQVTMRNAFTVELKGGGKSEAPPPPKRFGAPLPPLWEAAFHEASGTPFWFDRISGRTTWECPGSGAFVAALAAHPFRLEAAGAWEALPAAQPGALRARVVHDVVWERAVAGVGGWYIVRL